MPIFMRFFYLPCKMNGSRNRVRYCKLLHDPWKSGSLASFPTGNRKSLLHGTHDTWIPIAWTADDHSKQKYVGCFYYCISTNIRTVMTGRFAVYHSLWLFILDLCVVVYYIAILSYVKRDLILCLS